MQENVYNTFSLLSRDVFWQIKTPSISKRGNILYLFYHIIMAKWRAFEKQ